MSNEIQWCSWCFEKTEHKLIERNKATRNDYQCTSCGNNTVQCRFCDNMALHEDKWAHECCAEHDGTIASFSNLRASINELTEYKKLFLREQNDLFELGNAIKKEFIPILSGTWDLLTVTKRIVADIELISTKTDGLNGIDGDKLGYKYFKEMDSFDIIKVREGKGQPIVFINGFLSQNNRSAKDWLDGVEKHYLDNPCYLVNWDAQGLDTLLPERGVSIKRVIHKAVAKLVVNPWHSAMVKAAMTGFLLAKIITRTEFSDKIILMGHSLGARVIYYLLNTLAAHGETPVENVVLLGGAVGRDDNLEDTDNWTHALKAVSGKVYNCWSTEDDILRKAYQGANALQSEPIGLGKIIQNKKSVKLKNCNVSKIVDGHTAHKPKLKRILDEAGLQMLGA